MALRACPRLARSVGCSIPADIVHVVFAAMWAGGLVGLVHRAAEPDAGGTSGRTSGGRWPLPSARCECLRRRPAGEPWRSGTSTAVLERSHRRLLDRRPAGPPIGGARAAAGRRADACWLAHGTAWSGGSRPWRGSPSPWHPGGRDPAGHRRGRLGGQPLRDGLRPDCCCSRSPWSACCCSWPATTGYLLLPWPVLRPRLGAGPPAWPRGWRRLVSTVRLEALGMVAVLGGDGRAGQRRRRATAPALPPPVPFTQTQCRSTAGHVTLHGSRPTRHW